MNIIIYHSIIKKVKGFLNLHNVAIPMVRHLSSWGDITTWLGLCIARCRVDTIYTRNIESSITCGSIIIFALLAEL
jgi:hypothetical protein